MRTRIPLLPALIGALIAFGLLAGCGGDGSAAEADPQAVLDAALGGDQQIDSGVLNLQFDLQSQGGGGSLTALLEGPFQSSGDGSLPQLDLTASASADAGADSFDFEGGLTLTGDGAFVSYAGSDYEVDPATFSSLRQTYEQSSQLQDEQSSGGGLAQFGIDPASWVTDLTNEGTEDLDGTEVVHVSGSADVGKIVADVRSLAEQTGQAGQLDPAVLGLIESAVQQATIDVYADADDDTLRKLDLNVEIADPTRSAGTVSVALSVGIAEPNEAQEITAPANPRPFAELVSKLPPGTLGGLGGATVPATPSAPGASSSGGAPGGDGDPGAYLDCVREATDPTAFQECAKLLGG